MSQSKNDFRVSFLYRNGNVNRSKIADNNEVMSVVI